MESNQAPLTVTEATDAAGTTLTLTGEMNLHNVEQVFRPLLPRLYALGVDLALDMTGLDFIDSAGLADVITMQRQLRRAGRGLRVRMRREGQVSHVFEISQLDQLFPCQRPGVKTTGEVAKDLGSGPGENELKGEESQ